MTRILILLLCLSRTRTAYITDPPSFAERLDKLYEKLEKFTVAPHNRDDRLYAKLEKLNSLTPDAQLSEEDEILSAIQMWGTMSDDQLQEVIQGLREMKEDRSERLADDYVDGDWNDEDDPDSEGDYANDVGEDWDPLEDDISSTSKPLLGVTPSAFTRLDNYRHTIVSAVDPVAATKERPRILDDSYSTAEDRLAVRRAALSNIRTALRSGQCLTPQPRWLSVRKLAPAADTLYMPPCVQLHRCAEDTGCCHDEAQMCAPVDGKHIVLSFLLNKADGNLTTARMLFFNHTRCACVSKDTLQSTARSRIDRPVPEKREASASERQNDWRPPTEEPPLERDEEQASPQLRRCTCPKLFKNRITDDVCSCNCDWPVASRRRDCLSLARGREHFGLRDRVCVAQGDCNVPSCEYGPYERHAGRCPMRRYKRRFHLRGRYQPKSAA
ncbi:unnamed protein product [Leptidea sinapis]|uniref:Platelet-derived growth factor (PDGF) family profile domain-containing protein n=1 Tax=Leptidea sinapis TaxID=189913 RepID=A0A5E4R4K7_9NEOP|nr:unnamed protein product [Leptidea sinapis]